MCFASHCVYNLGISLYGGTLLKHVLQADYSLSPVSTITSSQSNELDILVFRYWLSILSEIIHFAVSRVLELAIAGHRNMLDISQLDFTNGLSFLRRISDLLNSLSTVTMTDRLW